MDKPEWRVYKAKQVLCKVCGERDSVLLPICVINGVEKMYPVCEECRDKVPYEVIPIECKMDEGYFYCPNIPALPTAA